MKELFRIETDRLFLTWSPTRAPPELALIAGPPPGRLQIAPRRSDLTFLTETWRAGVPSSVSSDPTLSVGPHLFEHESYSVFAESKSAASVEIRHRDPVLTRGLTHSHNQRVQHGIVNFRGQVGRSRFAVFVGGEPELEFEIEVFPTKLDYVDDYQAILADMQDLLSGLVVEYLRSTFQLGGKVKSPQPTHVEWLTLLRSLLGELERGIQVVAQRPVWGLMREGELVRSERLRRTDNAVRRAVLRGRGSGALTPLRSGPPVRARLRERRPKPTLNTPEHRWLATQLGRIRRRLAQILEEERSRARPRSRSERAQVVEGELQNFRTRVDRLLRLPPLEEAAGAAPPGFASLALLSSPGYREAYRACLALMLGLRIHGGPLELSVKDLHVLYEYWCYLALLRLVGEITGEDIKPTDLLAVEQHGLRVRVQKGRRHSVRFDSSADRRLTVTYNPLFGGEGFLVPQQPDLVLSVEDRNWPTVRLVLDAKYRVDSSPEYLSRHGMAGPPDDAVNVLHRYRDAILELESGGRTAAEPDYGDGHAGFRRSVIEGAVLYPHHPSNADTFRESRLWQSLERLGIGALPFLPDETGFVAEWLTNVLQRGGWTLADRVLPHRAEERARSWRRAAAEPVLVGVLRAGGEARHLAWIEENRLYYMPMRKTQRRQFAVRAVAIYSPTALRTPGAVTHWASVEEISVLPRGSIETPWAPSRGRQKLQVVYRIGSLRQLPQAIENRGKNGRGLRVSQPRWTSRLGLERAGELTELFLETEPEWRLAEELSVRRIEYHLEAGRVRLQAEDDPVGRASFRIVGSGRIQYQGAAGYVWERAGERTYFGKLKSLLDFLGEGW